MWLLDHTEDWLFISKAVYLIVTLAIIILCRHQEEGSKFIQHSNQAKHAGSITVKLSLAFRQTKSGHLNGKHVQGNSL